MWGMQSPGGIAQRFARLIEQLGGDTAAAKAMGQQRDLLAAVGAAEPATLNQVAARVKRGAPAVSRAIDALVRAGLVERQADPENRRRLALRLTEEGRAHLNRPDTSLAMLAVASATPSNAPIAATGRPSVTVRKAGSSA